MSGIRAALAGAAVGCVCAAAVPAFGYWTDSDAARASVWAATMQPPAATAAWSSDTVEIVVTAPDSGPAPEEYTVASGDGRIVCRLAQPGPCIDPEPSATFPRYVVTARLGSAWTASAEVETSQRREPSPPASASPPTETTRGDRPGRRPTASDGPEPTATVAQQHGLSVVRTNGVGATPRRLDTGDTVTLTLPRPVAPESICAGWASPADTPGMPPGEVLGDPRAHTVDVDLRVATTEDESTALILVASSAVCVGGVAWGSLILEDSAPSSVGSVAAGSLALSPDGRVLALTVGPASGGPGAGASVVDAGAVASRAVFRPDDRLLDAVTDSSGRMDVEVAGTF